ncbi:uncharacterized protein [Asterias amurensis]|uniref:uncharacterized protein n=1 Tax=Asterias amurensis TaxID=7602 RepID=UPI003AB8F10A
MAVFLEGACILIYLTVNVHLSQAMVCEMGQEPDSNAAHRYRWVIPVEDPCKCTEIRPGGINTRTPGRHFKVIYFDTILISNSPKEIRKWLNCPDASQDNRVQTELPDISTIQSAAITTRPTSIALATSGIPATSDILATSDKPVTSFSCLGRVNGGHYPDPYNCSMFYQCDNRAAIHKTCPPGTHFPTHGNISTCMWPRDADCNL